MVLSCHCGRFGVQSARYQKKSKQRKEIVKISSYWKISLMFYKSLNSLSLNNVFTQVQCKPTKAQLHTHIYSPCVRWNETQSHSSNPRSTHNIHAWIWIYSDWLMFRIVPLGWGKLRSWDSPFHKGLISTSHSSTRYDSYFIHRRLSSWLITPII